MMQKLSTRFQNKGLVALAAGLWLTVSVLVFFVIPATLDLVMRIYAAFWADGGFYGRVYQSAVGLRQLLVLPLSVVAVAVIIGGAEYQFQHFNTRQAWRILARAFAIELSLLLLAALI